MAFRTVPAGRVLRRLSAASLILAAAGLAAEAAQEPRHSAELDQMIVAQAKRNGVPEKLVRRIVMRESKYDPGARNHRYWGLMQISYVTAKSMGFKGTPEQLLNPLVNLTYAVPYLANAFVIAGKQEDEAVRLYAAGYYGTARKRGLLSVLRTAESAPISGADELVAIAAPLQPPISYGIFGSLFGANQPAAQPVLQQVADAAPAEDSRPAPSSAVQAEADVPNTVHTTLDAYDDKDSSPKDVVLVADRNGDLQPPKKWLHDGGLTEFARGEQRIEDVAAYTVASDETPAHKKGPRSHKTDVFASIDTPPSSAQAYASASQDSRFAQASSQDAITQATSVQTADYTSPSQDAAQPQMASAVPLPDAAGQNDQADEDQTKPQKKSSRKIARHHGSEERTTKIAKAKSKTVEVADAAPGKQSAHHPRVNEDASVVAAQGTDDDGLRH